MKQIIKKIVAATIILTLVLSGTMTAFAADGSGIAVQYNGKNLVLADAAKNINGRIMLPFREVLEAIGANVSYDTQTKKITAKTADREISFSAGKAEVSITQDGAAKSVKMDVAPYVEKSSSRTYVPVRFIAESLGYSVGWDSVNKTVVIIDPDTLFANADTDFSIISKLMKSDLDLEKAYATTGKFNMDFTTYASPDAIIPGMNFNVAGTLSGVQQKSNADLVMNMALNFDKMLSTLSAEDKAMIEPMLASFKNAEMKIKMNGETGESYMNSSLFSAMDPTAGTNTWYKMNVYDTYEQMGIDLKSLTGMNYNNVKLSEMLSASMSSTQYMSDTTYQDAKIMYSFMKNLMGDDAFAKKTSGTTSTYTLNIDQTAVLAALAKTALSEGVSQSELDMTDMGDILSSSKLSSKIVITEKSGALSHYDISGSANVEDVNCTFTMNGDPMNVVCDFSFDQKDAMSMKMNVESHVTESSKAPDLSLPSNAVVKDYPMPVVPMY